VDLSTLIRSRTGNAIPGSGPAAAFSPLPVGWAARYATLGGQRVHVNPPHAVDPGLGRHSSSSLKPALQHEGPRKSLLAGLGCSQVLLRLLT
jgi:hypothetical protein